MTTSHKIELLVAAHTRNMLTKQPWYNKQWLEFTKRLCVMASNLRREAK
jgi:hypothetical protein